MSRKRVSVWVLAVSIALTTRVAVAAPRATMGELRAAVCCATRCPNSSRLPRVPHRCCVVDSTANDPASSASAPALAKPIASPPAILAVAPAAPLLQGFQAARRALASRRDGPPGHPGTHKLRC